MREHRGEAKDESRGSERDTKRWFANLVKLANDIIGEAAAFDDDENLARGFELALLPALSDAAVKLQMVVDRLTTNQSGQNDLKSGQKDSANGSRQTDAKSRQTDARLAASESVAA
jgi:hypothetical protein